MTIPRQRLPQERRILSTRELTKDDLLRLRERREATAVKKIKDSHHFIARLFASGLSIPEVARRTGRTTETIRRVRQSPAFDQLVAEYREIVTAEWAETIDDYYEIVTANMVRSELMITDRLQEQEEDPDAKPIPLRDLMAISRDAADRFGYGKHTTQTNVNVDFAAQLERAIRRSGKLADPKVIEGKAKEVSAEPPQSLSAPAEPPALSRVSAGDNRLVAAVIPLPAGFRRRV